MTTITDIVGYVVGTNNMLVSYTDFTGNNVFQPNGHTNAWTNIHSSITSPGGTRPDGSSVQQLTEDNTTNFHQLVAFDPSGLSVQGNFNFITWRYAFLAAPSTRTRCVAFFGFSVGGGVDAGGGPQSNISVGFDLAGAQVFDHTQTADSYWNYVGSSITPQVGGYLLCIVDATFVGPLSPHNMQFYQPTIMLDNGSGLAARSINYVGDGSSSILLWWQSMMPKGAWTLTYQDFFDDFNSISTIDINDTRAPGYNWYVHNLFPNISMVDFGTATNPPSAPTPPANILVGSSICTITAHSTDANPGYMSQLWSVCYTGDIGGPPSGYRGFTWQMPAFLEMRMGYDAATYDANAALMAGYVTFWTLSLEGLIGTNPRVIELDFLEAAAFGPQPTKSSTIHEWNAPTFALQHYKAAGASGHNAAEFIPPAASGSNADLEVALASTTNRYAALVLNSASNDGTHGTIISFFNGHFWGHIQQWSINDGAEPYLPGGHTGVFYDMERFNFPIIMNTAATVTSHLPAFAVANENIDWVKVYTPPAGSLSALIVHDKNAISLPTQALDESNVGTGPWEGGRMPLDGISGVNTGSVIGTGFFVINPSAVTQPVTTANSSGGNQISVASSASSVLLLAANFGRLNATIYNDSTQILYLLFAFGGTASATSYTVQLAAGARYDLPYGYIGEVDGIWASANGFARITEVTA